MRITPKMGIVANMTKNDIIDKYWGEYVVWCCEAPSGKPHEVIFWLDHKHPTEDNFWEYMANVRAKDLKNEI